MVSKLQNEFEREREAIELGKVWMQKSKDTIHDFGHAQRVAYNSIKVCEELRGEGHAQEIDENLALLVAWWHDCYKATKEDSTIKDIFTEGAESAKIAKKELSPYLTKERLKRVLYAIENHQKVFLFFWKLKKVDMALRVIFEADGMDGLRRDRYSTLMHREKILAKKLFHFALHHFLRVFYFFFPKSKFSQNLYWKNLKQHVIRVTS